MAGTLSACTREESGLGDAAPATSRTEAEARSGIGSGRLWLLRGALALHVSALAFAWLHSTSLPSQVLLVSGIAIALFAIAVPSVVLPLRTASPVRPASQPKAPPHAETCVNALSPQEQGSGASPSPLPFMGDRIMPAGLPADLGGLTRAAARLNRLATPCTQPWGDLMARVSHELRTPLNAVIGFSDVMHSELLGPVGHPRYREYARHIGECGRDLLKSAEDTLAITCLLDHDPAAAVISPVDLATMVDEAWSFHCSPSSTHGLTLEAEIPEGLSLLVERRPMRQILINLLAEAVRRADARGTLGVVATADGDLAQIEVYLRGQPGAPSVGQPSLPMCLARALLELAGASLIEVDDPYSTWRAVTVLKCAAQHDFFSRLPEMKAPVQAEPHHQLACP